LKSSLAKFVICCTWMQSPGFDDLLDVSESHPVLSGMIGPSPTGTSLS
jgi:hypothetical protein